MMTEIWWKAFLAAFITVIVAKLFGCTWGIFLLSSIAFIGWSFGLVLFVIVGEWGGDSAWKKRKERRQG